MRLHDTWWRRSDEIARVLEMQRGEEKAGLFGFRRVARERRNAVSRRVLGFRVLGTLSTLKDKGCF